MPDIFLFTLATLACYRIAMLVTQDTIFQPIRDIFLFHRWNWVRNWLGELITCPYCFGVWVALFISLGLYGFTWDALVWWLPIAGGQAFMQSLGHRN